MQPLLSRWDRTARVDVFRLDASMPDYASRIGRPIDSYFFAQDASAGSVLVGVSPDRARADDLYERTLYGAGYSRGPASDVLIIGLGAPLTC